MEVSLLGRCEIQPRVPTTAGKFCSGINVAASQTKITEGRSATTPHLRSSFKVPFSAKFHGPLSYKRTRPRVNVVRATSVPDKEQGGIESKSGGLKNSNESKSGDLKNSNGNIWDVLGSVFKLALGILSQKKQEYQKIEEKVEHTADVVEEVAEDMEQAAKLAEDIAEKVEKESAKGGKIYKSAEMVDKISELVANNAEIVKNQAERVQETLKAVDNSVDKAEDLVEDIAKDVSIVGKDNGSSIKPEKLSPQTAEVKSG